jgi:hypothetical protein
MNEIDSQFYKLVVKERDLERKRVDRLLQRVKELEEEVENLEEINGYLQEMVDKAGLT